MENHESLIFVSIASYRDPQLAPTIADCIAKATDPEGLRFGICRQYDDDDAALPYHDDPRFRIRDVHWRESRGACWARAEVMKLWDGEDWFLQVDSHCRFAQGWDEALLRCVAATGSMKPILSTYATGFVPGEHESLIDDPMQIALQSFAADGIPYLRPAPLPIVGWPGRPVRARFLSAGFLFTIGDFVEDVPYDPELYFLGEEPAMTVRAFTHGYDLYHPQRTIVWHDYVRTEAKRHWGDHTDGDRGRNAWQELDAPSRQKIAKMLRGEPVGSFGLGSERTIGDYERYAGISFLRRRAQQSTLRAEEPPNPEAPPDWPDAIYTWIAKFTLERAELPAASLDDPHVWMVSIFDDSGAQVYRRDFSRQELKALEGGEPQIVIVVEFLSGAVPARWMVSPLSRGQSWLGRVSGTFQDGDFAILGEDDEPTDTER